MEHLTKQQIVLLTLLVSFVTALVTGIVTVSLTDQSSPGGITQTINRVVERTVERVVPSQSADTEQTASVAQSFEDMLADSVSNVSKSVVRIKPFDGKLDSVTGLGVIVSKDGVILTDKSAIASLGNLVARFSDGTEFPISVIQSQINGDIVFVIATPVPNKSPSDYFIPAKISSSIKLGQSVYSLSGKNLDSLGQGIVEKTGDTTNTSQGEINPIVSSISPVGIIPGSPIFNASGNVLGFMTTSFAKGQGAESSFYPASLIAQSIPTISR